MPKFWGLRTISKKLNVDPTAVLGRIKTENKRQEGAIKKSGREWRIPDEIAGRWIAERGAARAFNPKEDITQNGFIFDVLKLKSTLGKGSYKRNIIDSIPWEKTIHPNGTVVSSLPKGHRDLKRVVWDFRRIARVEKTHGSTKDFAKYLGVHEKSVRVLMKYDSLPVVKMGGKYYFSRQDTLNKTQRADLIRRVRAAEGEHRAYKRQRKLLKPKLSGLGQELLKKHGEANGKLVKDFVGLLEAGIRMFGRDITPSKARKFALRAGDSRDLRRSYERLQRAFNAPFTSAAEAKKIQKRIADTINRDADPNSKR